MFDMVLKGGCVVSPSGRCKTDVAVQDGKIAALGDAESLGPAAKVLDVEGKYLLPGLIDPHVHIAAPFMGCTGPLDFYSASKCAALGGVTSIIDFTNTMPGDSVIERIHARKADMECAAVDYGCHSKIVQATPEILDEIPGMVEEGCPTIKMFTTYRRAGVMIEDDDIIKVMAECAKWGARPGVHAEENTISEYNDDKFDQAGTTDWKYHYLSKPPLVEALATRKMIDFAQQAGSGLYIYHLTSRAALAELEVALERGQDVLAETCVHYLELDKHTMDDFETGYRFICSPPLRDCEDEDALWKALSAGELKVVSSDNCLYDDREKLSGLERDVAGNPIHDYKRVANGVSGLEERLPLLLTDGVAAGRLTLEKVVEITSTNPAKIFGIYPKKGLIQPGADADIAVVDLNREWVLGAKTLHYGIDSSVYEGKRVRGRAVMTLRRGEVIAREGVFCAEPASGEFLYRRLV